MLLVVIVLSKRREARGLPGSTGITKYTAVHIGACSTNNFYLSRGTLLCLTTPTTSTTTAVGLSTFFYHLRFKSTCSAKDEDTRHDKNIKTRTFC